MEGTAGRHAVYSGGRRDDRREGGPIVWAHNPVETTQSDLRWFLLIPTTIFVLVLAVNYLSIISQH